MYYIYVLRSLKDGEFYTGFTNSLERRVKEHNNKKEFSTKCRVPFEIVYYEACVTKEDAIVREGYLKSGKGKKYLKSRIRHYLESSELKACLE